MSSAGGQLLGHEVAAIIRNNPLYSGKKQSLFIPPLPPPPFLLPYLKCMSNMKELL